MIILFFTCLFSCGKKSKLEHALELAGENRIEIEKVLEHYKHEPLKLKAARFLIENMDTYSSVSSPELDAYYKTLDSIFSINNRSDDLTKEEEALLAQLKAPNPDNLEHIPDLQRVSAQFLIDNKKTYSQSF